MNQSADLAVHLCGLGVVLGTLLYKFGRLEGQIVERLNEHDRKIAALQKAVGIVAVLVLFLLGLASFARAQQSETIEQPARPPAAVTQPGPGDLVAVGSGGLMRLGGVVCSSLAGTCTCTAFVDAATINQWNFFQCTIPASALARNGDTLFVEIDWKNANNANTKQSQGYWNGGTCGGTGASMCTTGTQAFSGSSATTNGGYDWFKVQRVSSGNQAVMGFQGTQYFNQYTAATVTDTATVPIMWGVRNTSASAASVTTPNPSITVYYSPGQ